MKESFMPAISNTFGTEEPMLGDLLKSMETGSIQLPDFQRGWVWDDDRIKALIASVSLGYPVGALMSMETGGNGVRFSPRPFEGTKSKVTTVRPDFLMLDGQQRLTSLYLALRSDLPVKTRDSRNNPLERYYYLDMAVCLEPNADRIDAIISIPTSKMLMKDFGRKVDLDLSTMEKEFENGLFPLNIIFDLEKTDDWEMGFETYFNHDLAKIKFLRNFRRSVLIPFQKYKIPVIKLLKETPKEAVCQVFEHVNTGGVSLTVFELLTATFAADDFRLRPDWEERQNILLETDPVLVKVDEKDFLTAVTLFNSYKKHKTRGSAVSCKRKDVLNLALKEYKESADFLMDGFKKTARFLHTQKVFDTKNLPYQTQLIPLAAICSYLGPAFEDHSVREKISRWYWCGVLGELYGGANETRFALDLQNVIDWINGGEEPVTVRDGNFSPIRLLSLQTRNSAAYKGIMSLLMKKGCMDLINGDPIETTNYFDEAVDIHHIFPRSYCEQRNLQRKFWNSIVNKAPLTARTNRILSGKAPSKYIERLIKSHKVDKIALERHLSSHLIEPQLLKSNDFRKFVTSRARSILDMLETAMGKSVQGRDSDETLNQFGASL
jgi:hypothetical protein